MNLADIVISQYLATLEMLKRSIERCPQALWNDPVDRNKFWHVVYHALFYTHLYLQRSMSDFSPWTKHKAGYESFKQLDRAIQASSQGKEPYTRADIFEYLGLIQQEVKRIVPELVMDGPSGFDWQPISKMELQIYNIRHLQQHTGELMERLGSRANLDMDWIGYIHA